MQYCDILLLIGLFTVLCHTIRLVYKLVLPSHNLYKRYNKGWALITGGSDGIGLEFSRQLAKIGFNICIISRNIDKVNQVLAKIRQENPKVQTFGISADFSKALEEGFFDKIFKQIQNLDVSLLVNNVGYLSSPGPLQKCPVDDTFKEITINNLATSQMTLYFFKKMQKRQKSGIINLSSFSDKFSLRDNAVYGSSKTYIDRLTQCLKNQQGSDKIDLLSVKPNLVTTPMTRNQKSLIHSSAYSCVKRTLSQLGSYDTTAGSLKHQIIQFVVDLLPMSVTNKIMYFFANLENQKYKKIDAQNKRQN